MRAHISLPIITLILGGIIGWVARTKLDEFLDAEEVFKPHAQDPVKEEKKLHKRLNKKVRGV
jgi:hypothetical protein